ncbi:hypothetical protein BVG16_09360 [Paenibacillus selenitireducens]|uniref:Uncharacterized protein n=1 Tax=Paenibacillus selenitireducens TaxID=1324314 RepID=A0A1T2XHJ1_9BACL|nr:hypothetical protein [Paenibacillus selenitireducens]OPA79285.1 hypothetical protein BVG16_09360 [Paenibacillus selenitireducens]
MTKICKKFCITLATMVLLGTSFTGIETVNAATGNQGYAAYRDGVFFGFDWHAGLWDEPSTAYAFPILHAPGPGSVLKWDSYENFLDGNTFTGTFKPNTDPSSSARDLFVAMGRNLRTENISYNLVYQVYYSTDDASTYVKYDEISSMRCDGVIEYIYEWYSNRVYGDDTYWDVTKNSFWGRDHHSGTAVTPKKQVNYLTALP